MNGSLNLHFHIHWLEENNENDREQVVSSRKTAFMIISDL